MLKSDVDLKQELDALLGEDIVDAQSRESTAFAQLTNPAAPIVLFGAGNLGRRTLVGLRKLGIEPLCFVDSNQSRWGQTLDGLRLMGPEEAANTYGQDATFVVTVWGALARDRMASRVEKLRQLNCRTVITFVPLYWSYPAIFLPHYTIDLPHRVLLDRDRIRQAFDLLADNLSRREFLAQLRFRLRGEFEALSWPVDGPMYFRSELFQLGRRETLVDCGAFDGDTIELFLQATGGSFHRIVAFEPDPENFAKLSHRVNCLPVELRERIELHSCATGAVPERVRMQMGSGPASHVGSGEQEVECTTLDSALGNLPVTFIKMDIEGSEIDTLAGARKSIRENGPVLAISAYHRQADLWNIPLSIHQIRPDYAFHLRPHMVEAWDLVCYAVRPNRT
jgi:FkbM family methyltransferase